MRIFRILVLMLFTVFSAACNLTGENTPAPQPATDLPVDISVSTPVSENLALGKTVVVSAELTGESSKNAIDGDFSTIWNSGASSPQWIQIDLGDLVTVSRIRLTVSQSPHGETTHQVFVGKSSSDLRLVHQFSGTTLDDQVLEFRPTIPLAGIQFVKIFTLESPSWVAWKEIEVWGNESGDAPPASEVRSADVIYFNGTILTMEKNQPLAQAIAIQGDKILAVGTEDDVMSFGDDETVLIDLQGLTLTPGFIDSHSHRIGDRWHFGEASAEEMMEKALSQGWTSIHELFVFDQRLEELENMARASILPLRVSMYLTMNFDYDYTPWWQAYQPLQQFGPYLQAAGLKITLDREWGEQVFFSQGQYNQMILDGTQSGWQIATHAFSPKANQIVLTGYETGLNGQNNDILRLRLEHVGTMTDEQLRKMAELGIIGSVQFINTSLWVEDPSFKKYIPAEEIQHTSRWRDLIDAGVFLIGNTDDPWCCTDWRNEFRNPPNDPSVVQTIYQGVTRTTFTGKQPEAWQAAQVVTVQEALEMLTINGAYAAHQEDVIGSLKPGKYADIVILSGNPLETPTGQIPDIHVVMTMVGGDVKYCDARRQDVCVGP